MSSLAPGAVVQRRRPACNSEIRALGNCTAVKEVRAGSVVVTTNVSKSVPDPYVTWAPLLSENVPNPLAKRIREELREEEIAADLVIIAAGARATMRLTTNACACGRRRSCIRSVMPSRRRVSSRR